MTLTPEWLINQRPLETLARRISVDEGQQQTPELRDSDVAVPGMDGELDLGMDPTTPRRSYGPGQIVFTGWVQGVDPDTGQLGWGISHDMYLAQVDALIALFSPRLLVIDRLRVDGTRQAVGALTSTLAVTRERTSPVLGRWKATVKIPGAFWSGLTDVTISSPGLPNGGVLPLGGLAAGNAPITDAVITFGPGSNPALVQGGTFLAYDGVIAAGRQLVVDVAARECSRGSGTVWTPSDASVRFGPSPRWFDLDPAAGALTLTHTGGGQMSCSVTARPKYQTS